MKSLSGGRRGPLAGNCAESRRLRYFEDRKTLEIRSGANAQRRGETAFTARMSGETDCC